MRVNLKMDFFEVAPPKGTSFSGLLGALQNMPNDETRNVEIRGNPLRLADIGRSGKVWVGDLVRIRMEQIPVKASRQGSVAPFDLSDDEGVGEQCAFLYHEGHKVLVLQRNRYALSAGLFARYFEEMGEAEGPIELLPMLRKDALKRLRRMSLVRKVGLRLSGTDRGVIWADDGVGASKVGELAREFRAPEVEITMSVGKKRKETLVREHVGALIKRLRPGNDQQANIQKLYVAGADEDGAPEVVDFIQDRLRDEVQVEAIERLLSFKERKHALHEAWQRQRDTVQLLLRDT